MARQQESPQRKDTPHLLGPGLVELFALVLVAVAIVENHRFFHDDTFITLRYARHLLAGHGPVWNTSGPRVEGYTSVLHLGLIALLGAMGLALPSAARLVNFASHLLLLVVVGRALLRRTNALGAAFGTAIVAASWTLIVWDFGGLDATLYTLLSAAGILSGLQAFNRSMPRSRTATYAGAAWLAVATLARPEGGGLLVGLLLFTLLDRARPLREQVLVAMRAAAIAFLILLPSTIFRWIFFHALVPNTVAAKVGGIHFIELLYLGSLYLLNFLVLPPFLALLTGAAALFALRKRKLPTQDAVLWGFIGIIVLTTLTAGGDHMVASRLWAPLIPLLAFALVRHLYETDLLSGRSTVTLAAVLAIALGLQIVTPALNPKVRDPAAEQGQLVADYIGGHWPAGSTVALNTAGSTPYFADSMQYIDMLGLNDAEIARRRKVPVRGPWTHLPGHLKGDGASVLARRPSYIILGPTRGTTPELNDPAAPNYKKNVYFIGDYEIGRSPVFRTSYKLCSAALADQSSFLFYQRVDLPQACPALTP